jgi:UDP-N-acetylglucosamine:LPS N-acetylglucosamine transferase
LARHINDLIGNDGKLKQMAASSALLAPKDAAAAVAATMEKYSAHDKRV